MTLNMTFDDEEQAVHDGPEPKETITLPHKDISKQEKAWESSKTDRTDEPITTQDVAGTASVGKPTPLPDRALVVPELKKFLAERKPPEENPIVAQAQKIEQALHQIQQPAQPIATFEEQMMAKMEALEQRDYERQQREAEANSQAEYDRKMADFKSNIVSNIESRTEDFPAIIALGRTEEVASQLIQALDNDETISEEELTSDIEQGLWEIYSKLEKARKPSKATTSPSAKPDITPQVVTQTQPTQDDFNIHKYSGKKQAQEALWERIKAAGDTN